MSILDLAFLVNLSWEIKQALGNDVFYCPGNKKKTKIDFDKHNYFPL